MNFKPYVVEDKASSIFNELHLPSNSLGEELWPGTQGSLEDLRAQRASGRSWEEISAGTIDTDLEREAWSRLTAQIDEDIETMALPEEETSETTSNEASEEASEEGEAVSE